MNNNSNRFLDRAREQFLAGLGTPAQAPFQADQFQLDAINSITEGYDTLVVAPTGSGKTYIAFQCIDAILGQGLRAVYTTPLKALSNGKFNELKSRFEPQYKVGILTGDRKIQGDANVVVSTTEIYRNELYRSSERYSLVVLDEVHFLSDQQRGPVWEESIILTPRSATLLMLSASISNAAEIAEWIEEVRQRECRIVMKTNRSVELRFGFLHPQFNAIPLIDENGGVLREVREYYSQLSLDNSGMRLKSRNGEDRGRRGFGRGGPRRGSQQPGRSKFRGRGKK